MATTGYVALVRRLPRLYRFLRKPAESLADIGPFRSWVGRYAARNLSLFLRGRIPDAVVCTHPFACGVMAQYKMAYAPSLPLTAVLTDFSAHPFWVHPAIDRYVVAHDEMKNYLIERGIADARIDVSGIPIDDRFAQLEMPIRTAVTRTRLGLPSDRYVVMLMGGGLGVGPLAAMLDELAKLRFPIFVVVVAGRNERYRAFLARHAKKLSIPVKVVGFIANVHEYMHVIDLLMTKPGGLSCAEVMAARVPTILTAPLPGPEEANAAYLESHGAVLYARHANEFGQLVTTALTNPMMRLRLVHAMQRVAHPNAAAAIAARVVGGASSQLPKVYSQPDVS